MGSRTLSTHRTEAGAVALGALVPVFAVMFIGAGCRPASPPAVPTTAASTAAGDAAAEPVSALVARQQAVDTVTRLFNQTDARNWAAVEALFADSVDFDMTSVAGGSPSKMAPKDIVAGWSEGLAAVDQVHHQAGNFLVDIDGDVANVTCYGIATHFRKQAEKSVTTFVGSYEFRLERVDGAWKIHAFKFNLKYMN